MKKIFIFSIASLAMLLVGCGKPVPLDVKLKAALPQMNIFGRLDNNELTSDYVYVKKSISYLNPADSVEIPDASVLVKDGNGQSWLFYYSKQFGVYLPPANYTGVEIGKTYYLEVNHAGKLYTAQSTVQPYSPNNDNPILRDSVEKKNGQDKFFGDTVGYSLTVYFKDAPQTKNYYYVDITRNDTLLLEEDGNYFIYTMDDQFVDPNNPEGTPLQFFQTFQKFDKVRTDIYTLDYEAFKYYEAIGIQANNGGTIFDGPPANISGNVSNALGYFLASASFSDTLTIQTK